MNERVDEPGSASFRLLLLEVLVVVVVLHPAGHSVRYSSSELFCVSVCLPGDGRRLAGLGKPYWCCLVGCLVAR